MTVVILLIAALVLIAAMLYLSLCVNEFEKQTLALDAIVKKRYIIQPLPKKKDKDKEMQDARPGVKLPPRP